MASQKMAEEGEAREQAKLPAQICPLDRHGHVKALL